MIRFLVVSLLSAWLALVPFAAAAELTTLELYVRNDSEACRGAVEVANRFAAGREGLRVVVHDVLADQEALRTYWQRVKQAGIARPVMPGTACGTQFRVGFDAAAAYQALLDDMLTIRVFAREGCPHCRDAKRFLADLVVRRTALRVETFDVVRDAEARRRMEQVAAQHSKRVTGLPVIEAGGQLFVGYQTDATSGKRIEALFAGPADKPDSRTGALPSGAGPIRLAVRQAPRLLGIAGLWRQAPPAALVLLQVAAPSGSDLPPPPPPTDLPPPPDDAASPPPPQDGEASASLEESESPADEIELPYFGAVRVSDWGLPVFTLLVGLVDGFNPCAMWVLVFLLSVLVNVRSRVRILAIAGTFVVVSGLAYFAFMAAWLNIFMLLGLIRPLQITLGAVAIVIGVLNVKDFVAFHRGPSLSIPESVKPGIYERVRQIVSARSLSAAVTTAVVLAILVNTVELLCTAGLPALYGEILTLQKLPWWENYLYLGLYIAAYMFDDTLLLSGFVYTLSHRKLQERQGRWLKLLSGVVILLLGAAMIFRPDLLHFTK